MHAFLRISPHLVGRELLMHMITHNLERQHIAYAWPIRVIADKGTLQFKGAVDRLSNAMALCGGHRVADRPDNSVTGC
jgi:hypothetical protein